MKVDKIIFMKKKVLLNTQLPNAFEVNFLLKFNDLGQSLTKLGTNQFILFTWKKSYKANVSTLIEYKCLVSKKTTLLLRTVLHSVLIMDMTH